MGSLMTILASGSDTNGNFALVEFLTAKGNEPPPHVHEREDELYYVLEGEFEAHIGSETYQVTSGDCVFMPRGVPRALVEKSPRVRLLLLATPAGMENYFLALGEPAGSMELPTNAVTYSQADLTRAVQLAAKNGVRFLSAEEIAEQLPHYPRNV
jgi:quercetin dioxygenase-like cupin family protein